MQAQPLQAVCAKAFAGSAFAGSVFAGCVYLSLCRLSFSRLCTKACAGSALASCVYQSPCERNCSRMCVPKPLQARLAQVSQAVLCQSLCRLGSQAVCTKAFAGKLHVAYPICRLSLAQLSQAQDKFQYDLSKCHCWPIQSALMFKLQCYITFYIILIC